MLKIIETFNNSPICVSVSPNLQMQPGQIGSLVIKQGSPVLSISDGLNPLGIIDDIRSHVIRKVPEDINQLFVLTAINPMLNGDKYVLSQDQTFHLPHHNIIAASFTCNVNVILDLIAGKLTFVAGTICNFDQKAIQFSCRYAYNTICDSLQDSISGTHRATVWTQNMIAETDIYDTTVEYPKYANLYVAHGLLTTSRFDFMCKSVGIVLPCPEMNYGLLRFLWDAKGTFEANSSLDPKKVNW